MKVVGKRMRFAELTAKPHRQDGSLGHRKTQNRFILVENS